MTSPDSETAWHFSSFGTESDDNQRMDCSSVPSAWLAKVPERILHVAPRDGVEDTRLEAKAKDTKKSEAKAKDSLSEDRHSRGQGQECSRPRPRTKDTSASALRKKKKVFTKIFQAISTKKTFSKKIFQALHKILTIQKIVLSSRRGQANFRGLEASRPRPRTSKCVLEAKDVLEDSTSGSTPPFPFAECFVSKSLRLIFALQRETSKRVSKMLKPSSSGNQIPKVFAGGKSLGLAHRNLDAERNADRKQNAKRIQNADEYKMLNVSFIKKRKYKEGCSAFNSFNYNEFRT